MPPRPMTHEQRLTRAAELKAAKQSPYVVSDDEFKGRVADMNRENQRSQNEHASAPDGGKPKPIEADTEIKRLAKLSTIEYGKARGAAAKGIGVNVAALDAAVKQHRKESKKADGIPASWSVEAAAEPADGCQLLDAIKEIFERYIVLPPHTAAAITLWVMHTWTIDAADISPILALISPEPRCGKTTVLKILNRLTRRAALASNISTPALFRYIEAEQPTLLIDEADSFLKENEEMRGVLNSGHSREAAYVIRCEGEDMTPKKFSTWGAKAIAAIKKLPATLTDRSVTAHMRRKMRTEKRPRYRDYDREEYQTLRSQALRWATDNQKRLASDDPPVPNTLDDRAADNWRPLLAIADLAGGGWPEAARQAACALSGAIDDTLGIRLLRDIQWIFNGKPKTDDATGKAVREYDPVEQMPSKELVERLVAIEDSPWADWESKKGFTQNALARQLEPYRIGTDNVRIGPKVLKGYKLAHFGDVFEAYLGETNSCPAPPGGDFCRYTLQANNDGHNSQNQTATVPFDVADEKSQKPASNGQCSGVAAKNPPEGCGRASVEIMPPASEPPGAVHHVNGWNISRTPEDRQPPKPGELASELYASRLIRNGRRLGRQTFRKWERFTPSEPLVRPRAFCSKKS